MDTLDGQRVRPRVIPATVRQSLGPSRSRRGGRVCLLRSTLAGPADAAPVRPLAGRPRMAQAIPAVVR
jgi:hypothetical protein